MANKSERSNQGPPKIGVRTYAGEAVHPSEIDIRHQISNLMNEKPTFDVCVPKLPDLNDVVTSLRCPLMEQTISNLSMAWVAHSLQSSWEALENGRFPSLIRTPVSGRTIATSKFNSYRIGDASLFSKGKLK